jgi:Domain of unknown function (DUF3291)
MTNLKKITIDGIEVDGVMAVIRATGLTKPNRLEPSGHRPTLDDALERLEHLEAKGDSDHAFGWKYLKEAQAWKTHGCAQVAAE